MAYASLWLLIYKTHSYSGLYWFIIHIQYQCPSRCIIHGVKSMISLLHFFFIFLFIFSLPFVLYRLWRGFEHSVTLMYVCTFHCYFYFLFLSFLLPFAKEKTFIKNNSYRFRNRCNVIFIQLLNSGLELQLFLPPLIPFNAPHSQLKCTEHVVHISGFPFVNRCVLWYIIIKLKMVCSGGQLSVTLPSDWNKS